MKIKAAVLREFSKPLAIETLDLESPQVNEVLVKYVNTGFCNSDLHMMEGSFGPVPLPLVIGHEAAGVVEEVGPGVENVKKGDRVIVPWLVPCGKCPECLRGKSNICRNAFAPALGGTLFSGGLRMKDKGGNPVRYQTFVSGFATHMVVDASGLIHVHDEMPLDQACFMGCCVPTGWGAVTNKADVQPGDSVVIYGAGGVGLNAIRAAASRQANPLIVVDLEGSKEKMAREFGATHFINSSEEDPVPKIKTITGGVLMEDGQIMGGGADVVIEAIGDPGAYIQAFWSLGMAGKLVAVGIVPADQIVPVPMTFLTFHDKTILGSLYGSISTHLDIPRYSELAVRGDMMLDKLTTKHFKLEDMNEVADAMRKREIQGRWVCDLD